jgi:hypothetical protein
VSTSVFRNEVVNILIFWDVAPCRLAVTDVSEKQIFSIFRMKQNNYASSFVPPTLGPGILHSSGLRRLLTLRMLDSTIDAYVHAPMHFDNVLFWDRLASHLPPSWFVNCSNDRLMRSETML